DNSVSPNNKYFYQVRAKNATSYSTLSNTVSTITPVSIVYVNLADQNNGGSPWNNTNKSPVDGDVFGNLKNDKNNNSGINLIMDDAYEGAVNYGVSTGNNSGIFPDNITVTNYWLNKNQVVKLRLSGLDYARHYRIGFSGSYAFYGNFNTTYTIGNRTVYLNTYRNSTKAVYIGD